LRLSPQVEITTKEIAFTKSPGMNSTGEMILARAFMLVTTVPAMLASFSS